MDAAEGGASGMRAPQQAAFPPAQRGARRQPRVVRTDVGTSAPVKLRGVRTGSAVPAHRCLPQRRAV